MTPAHQDLLANTTSIVVAAIERSIVQRAEIPTFIGEVFNALSNLGGPVKPVEATLTPAVNPKASIKPDYIICLEDGKRFKSLKRHLRTTFNLTPEEYRRKWSLPDSYPMVAPDYATRRSLLAKASGLGRKRISGRA